MTEPQAPTFDALAEAKRLLRSIRAGTLATLASDGAPFASLTAFATMPDGMPILLVSRLAAHTLHLEHDGRCSLLLAQSGKGDPLAYPRLTLIGHAAPAGARRDAARTRFLARNPKAKLYADFPDFAFWIVTPQAAHLNGGFGRAASLAGDALLTAVDGCDELIAGEDGALEHMNADHREAIGLYATQLLGQPAGDWRLSGIDPDGLDLVLGDQTARLAFSARVSSGSELRKRLVLLAADARKDDAPPAV